MFSFTSKNVYIMTPDCFNTRDQVEIMLPPLFSRRQRKLYTYRNGTILWTMVFLTCLTIPQLGFQIAVQYSLVFEQLSNTKSLWPQICRQIVANSAINLNREIGRCNKTRSDGCRAIHKSHQRKLDHLSSSNRPGHKGSNPGLSIFTTSTTTFPGVRTFPWTGTVIPNGVSAKAKR